jgi:hypothetical protein
MSLSSKILLSNNTRQRWALFGSSLGFGSSGLRDCNIHLPSDHYHVRMLFATLTSSLVAVYYLVFTFLIFKVRINLHPCITRCNRIFATSSREDLAPISQRGSVEKSLLSFGQHQTQRTVSILD